MRLALRQNTVIDILGSVANNPTTGPAVGAAVGSIVPGAGTAAGAAIGAAVQSAVNQVNQSNAEVAYNDLLNQMAALVGSDIKAETDTALIAWALAFNGERKALPDRLAAGQISSRLAARYKRVYDALIDALKAELGKRGYSKGAGIPEGRNPNVDTGYTTTGGKAPKANALVTEAGLVSASGVSKVVAVGLVGALIAMFFGKK